MFTASSGMDGVTRLTPASRASNAEAALNARTESGLAPLRRYLSAMQLLAQQDWFGLAASRAGRAAAFRQRRTPTALVLVVVAAIAATVLARTAVAAALSVNDSRSLTQADSFDRLAARQIAEARDRTLDACRERGIELPPDFLAWIDGDPVVKASVYGCRRDPLPVLLGLRSLEIDLGEEVVRRDYTQLALAFAIQGSYAPTKKKASTWNDGDGDPGPGELPDVSPRPPLVLEIPGDPRVQIDTRDSSRELDAFDHVINFLEDHPPIEVEVEVRELPPLEYDERGVAKPRGKPVKVSKTVERGLVGADVIASPELQAAFNDYLASHGHPEVRLDCGDHAVHWKSSEAVHDKDLRTRIKAAHDLFHDAYRAKGRMPQERDRAPTASESMAWFIRNDRHDFSGTDRMWPRFPLNAPWPVLLMLAADDQPLREREAIWEQYRDEGEFRTYGEYIGGIAQQFDMQSARRVSPFAYSYGSIQMMWKDGGVCGTMGNIGARTHRICGVPASTAGQPGHCAIVFMERDAATGAFRCKGGQYATGGDEVTTVHAGWNYDDLGGRRPMVFHQSVAWGVNEDFESLLEAMVVRRAWDALEPAERGARCVRLVEWAVPRNPYSLVLVDAAIAAAPDAATAIEVLDAFNKAFAPHAEKSTVLYADTVRDLAHGRVLSLPSPGSREAIERLLGELERQGCVNPRLLARCWQDLGGEAFLAETRAAAIRYLDSDDRMKSKRPSEAFARMVDGWAKSIRSPAHRKAWAEAMLEAFAGREVLVVRRKKSVDPSVVKLSKFAGRPAPTVEALEAASPAGEA